MSHRQPILRSSTAIRIVAFVGIAGALALLATAYLAVLAWKEASLDLIVALAALWAVLPPIWFWLEYHFIYLRCEARNERVFDRFKYSQQVSIAVWAGVALTLGAMATSDHFKPPATNNALDKLGQNATSATSNKDK